MPTHAKRCETVGGGRSRGSPRRLDAPATLRLTLSRSRGGKTAMNAHLERLPDADAREAMRDRWRGALERIAPAAASVNE